MKSNEKTKLHSIIFFVSMLLIVCCNNGCIHKSKNTAQTKVINNDSLKDDLQQQFDDVLATLDSAIGNNPHTKEDSLLIQQLNDSATNLQLRIDSLSGY